MKNSSPYDLSHVGPHRRHEVLRRIRILDAYIAGEITGRQAMTDLDLSEPTFRRLLRIWRATRKPELIGASGRVRQPRVPVTSEQKHIIEEVERTHPDKPIKQLVQLCLDLGRDRGVPMPGIKNTSSYARQYRRERGLRPEGVHDLVLGFCAIDLPIAHPRYGIIAPIMSVLLDVSNVPVPLGVALSQDEPSPALAARTLLDAIARAEAPRQVPAHEFQLPTSTSAGWNELARSVEDAGLNTRQLPLKPRSARRVTDLLGKRPGGIELFPDLSSRPANQRTIRLRPGQPIAIRDAEELIRGRLRTALPGHRMEITNDAEARGRLSAVLQLIAAG